MNQLFVRTTRLFAGKTRWKRFLGVCVAALVLCSPGALPSASPKTSGECHAGHYRYYYVYYRTCPHDTWHYYGATAYPAQASAAVIGLQRMGYQAFCR